MTTATPAPADAPAVGFRMRWYPRVALAAVVVAFAVFLVAGSGSDAVSGRVGGDYPAFYAAGRIVVDDPGALYDFDRLEAEQRELLGDDSDGGAVYFPYPPYVAALYAPLAQLPYRLSYAVTTVAMAGFLVLALWRLRPLVPAVDRYFEQAAILTFFFYPMFRAVTGGQTTAVVLVLLAVGFRGLYDRHDVVAGVAFAGLLFKPQYALAMLGVSLLVGRWRVVAAGAATAVVLYLAGAALQGWGWLGPYGDMARWYQQYDAEVNQQNASSWLGATEAVWGVGEPLALALGWALAVATAGFLAWVWWADRGEHLGVLLALSCPALLLMSPHAMYYDAGLVALTLAVLAGDPPRRLRLLAAVFAAAFLQPLADTVGMAPTFFVVAGIFVWAMVDLVDTRALVASLPRRDPLRPVVRMGAPAGG